jgi:acetolactate synthase-1/2/3 large subunit
MYPGGYASRSNRVPLTHLDPAPDYEVVVTASGGYGAKVEEPDDLMPALEKARDVVINKKRPAVLNVMTEGV